MKYLFFASLVFLAGCSTKDIEPEVDPLVITVNTETTNTIPILPDIEGVNATDVEWQVLTYDILMEMFNDPDFNKDAFVVIALSVDDYEEISITFAEILRWMEQTNAKILFYEQAIGG